MDNIDKYLLSVEAMQKHIERFNRFVCDERDRARLKKVLLNLEHCNAARWVKKYDPVSLILKGHLLIEEVLTGILEDALEIELPVLMKVDLRFIKSFSSLF